MIKRIIIMILMLASILIVVSFNFNLSSFVTPETSNQTRIDSDTKPSQSPTTYLIPSYTSTTLTETSETPSTPIIQSTNEQETTDVEKKIAEKSFTDDFNTNYTVREVGSKSKTNNEHWWVSSGGYFYSKDGFGSTINGRLPSSDERRIAYLKSNPLDTDGGFYPQNIFRLVQTDYWQDFEQAVYFKIVNENFSTSPNRNSSNGVLFFNRYQDAFNLYYTGIRVDGLVTIKRKYNGVYTTLAEKKILNGIYDREMNLNLIPTGTWIGLKTIVYTDTEGLLHIKVYTDLENTGLWSLALETTDDSSTSKGVLYRAGHAGIRTDFMDVKFKNYSIHSLASN